MQDIDGSSIYPRLEEEYNICKVAKTSRLWLIASRLSRASYLQRAGNYEK